MPTKFEKKYGYDIAERAAIIEYDGKISRKKAEKLAIKQLKQNKEKRVS